MCDHKNTKSERAAFDGYIKGKDGWTIEGEKYRFFFTPDNELDQNTKDAYTGYVTCADCGATISQRDERWQGQ